MKRITAMIGAGVLTGLTAILVITLVVGTANAQTITEEAGAAGTVTFSTDGGVLSFVQADPADGWDFAVVREDPGNLKVVFRNTSGGEMEFEAELEAGQVIVAATNENAGTVTTSTTAIEIGGATSTSLPGNDTTSTTIGGDTTSTTFGDDTTSTTLDDGDDRVRERIDGFVGTAVVSVAHAGTVTVAGNGDSILLGGVDVASGWGYEIDRSDDQHIEIRFSGPDGVEIEFEAQFMGDHLDWRYEFESDDGDTTSTTLGDDTTSTTMDDSDDDTTSTTMDDSDDGDDDDNSGSGGGDDDDASDDD